MDVQPAGTSERGRPVGEHVTAEPRESWHARSVEDVAHALHSLPGGLTRTAAAARLEAVGRNVLEGAPPRRLVAVVVDQFRSPLIYVLLIAAVVTLLLHAQLDAAVIAAALVLNAVVGTVQQRRAEQSVRALQQLMTPTAHVLRDGHVHEVDSSLLVPGDVVLLESGDRVPADLRLSEAASLTVDESLLTGESLPVGKQAAAVPAHAGLADRRDMAFSGTVVSRGRGRGYVVATGTSTELGRIAEYIKTVHAPATPLQRRLDRFARVVGVAALGAAVLAFVTGLALGQPLRDIAGAGVALAVSAIPEGLPVVFTVVMAVGVTRMARRHAIIRRLAAVETLGSTTVICSDKTGTLTRNEMTVQEVRTAGGRFTTEDGGAGIGAEDFADNPELFLTLLVGVLASEAEAYRVDGELTTTGDPTEAALVRVAAAVGLEPVLLRSEHERHAHLPFEPERRFAAALAPIDGATALVVQGAPEQVLPMCTHQLRKGTVEAIAADELAAEAHTMAARGLRVLAFASRRGSADELGPLLERPQGLTFLGLQGMADPPRDGVAEAVAACREAGIRVVMVTGDHVGTAQAVATDVGLAGDAPAVTGAQLEELDDAALRELLADATVFARVSPEQKLRIVEALRDLGEVVAVTGDGVNDAPALQAAHIGIAMGREGTDVAREAADMVLADDNFVSIRAAVEEGRVAFDNLRKVTFFLISTGAAEILMVLSALALRWPLVLLPAQLLWLNLVTNGLQDVALAFEPGERGVLRRPPRPQHEGLISKLLWQRTGLVAVVMATGALTMFAWTLETGGSVEQARTAAMTTMVLFQAVHAGNSRLEHRSAFASPPWANRFLLASVVGALSLHLAALHLAPTQWLLRVEPLTLRQWVAGAAVALSVLVVVEIDKALRRRTGPATSGS